MEYRKLLSRIRECAGLGVKKQASIAKGERTIIGVVRKGVPRPSVMFEAGV